MKKELKKHLLIDEYSKANENRALLVNNGDDKVRVAIRNNVGELIKKLYD